VKLLSANELRKFIVGAWTLESYESVALDGLDVRHPLGLDAKGIIMYTADGYMSAQLMRQDRPRFRNADLASDDIDELAAAASGYLAYSGSYSVSDNGVIAHHVDVSLLPNWVGGTQVRTARISESRLQLSPIQPVLLDGQHRMGRLTWRRP
jgi:hypothetical protein